MAVADQETSLDDALSEGAEDLGFPAGETTDADFEVVVNEGAEEGAEAGEVATEEGAAEESAAAPEAAAEGEQQPESTEGETDFAELETAPPAFRKAVKARWEREKRLRAQIIGERDQIRDAAVQVATIAKQREQELTTVKAQMLELQRQHAEVLEVTFDKEIALKSKEMRAARDNNDYDAEQKLQGELETLRFQQNQIKEARRNIPAAPTASATPTPTPAAPAAGEAPGAQPAPAKKPLTPAAAKWIANNKVWLESPKFAGHREFVVGVDRQLQREGYLPTTDEFFKELDRRVDEAFPTLRKKPQPTNLPPVAAVGGGAQSAPGKRTVTLNKADLENMRRFGLDPTNKAHLREYASNKVA